MPIGALGQDLVRVVRACRSVLALWSVTLCCRRYRSSTEWWTPCPLASYLKAHYSGGCPPRPARYCAFVQAPRAVSVWFLAACVTLGSLGCSADRVGQPTGEANGERSIVVVIPSVTVAPPAATARSTRTSIEATTTRPSTRVHTTTTQPATTTTVDPADLGLLMAQQLATAFADGDWATARRISPIPAWDDATYEEGFAGLERAEVVLADSSRGTDQKVQLWLAQIAHESRPEGRQTSVYCILWIFDPATRTIARESGHLLVKEAGFVPPGDLRRGAGVECDPSFAPPTSLPSTPDPGPAPRRVPDLDGWIVVTFEGQEYICQPAVGWGADNYNCTPYDGGEPPDWVPVASIRCSKDGLGEVTCTGENYYPSEIEGYELVEIDGERALCDDLDRCWLWAPLESPRSATWGPPDYRCLLGLCERS